MKNNDNILENQSFTNHNEVAEEDKEILLMIEYMKSKWTNGLVEVMNCFEYVHHNDEDFMSELREFLFIVELTLRGEEVTSININGETFIEDSLPGFRYFTKNASVKYAYSFDEEPPIGVDESYFMRIEWIELDYNLDL